MTFLSSLKKSYRRNVGEPGRSKSSPTSPRKHRLESNRGTRKLYHHTNGRLPPSLAQNVKADRLDLTGFNDHNTIPDSPINTTSGVLDNTLETAYCSVCMEHVSLALFPEVAITSHCNHPLTDICVPCIRGSINSQFSYKSPENISCSSCNVKLEPLDMRRNAEAETYARYETIINRAAMEKLENFVWCSTPGCDHGQVHSDPRMAIVVCMMCHGRTCFRHRTAWHEGLSCSEADNPAVMAKLEYIRQERDTARATEKARKEREAAARLNEQEKRNVEAAKRMRQEREKKRSARREEETMHEGELRRESKRCIGASCPFRAVKPQDCKHVTCAACQREYCWICFKPWVAGHLSVQCSLGKAEKRKITELEEKDMVRDSVRLAEEERKAQADDDLFEKQYLEDLRQKVTYPSSARDHSEAVEHEINRIRKKREQERQRHRKDDEKSEIEIRRFSGLCVNPRCDVQVEKRVEGCRFMTCRACSIDYCWTCRKIGWSCRRSNSCSLGEAEQRRDIEHELEVAMKLSEITAAEESRIRAREDQFFNELRAKRKQEFEEIQKQVPESGQDVLAGLESGAAQLRCNCRQPRSGRRRSSSFAWRAKHSPGTCQASVGEIAEKCHEVSLVTLNHEKDIRWGVQEDLFRAYDLL